MKKIYRWSIILLIPMFLISCGNSQGKKDAKQVEHQQSHYAKGQPIPFFEWSLERDLVNQLYNARNDEVATHTVWRSNTGLIEGDCKSIGFGIPYDTSLTNPLKRVHGSGGNVVVEQAEPNGIFASKNSNATWVMCVVMDGKLAVSVPFYIESKVTVYPMPVTVNYASNRVTFDGKPSVIIKRRK